MDEDTQAATEWQEYKDSLCPGCGHERSECMDSANQFAYTATALRCFVCQERDGRAYQWNKSRSEGGPPEFGVYWSVASDGPDDE